jgi:hypothetical protein
VAAVRGIDDRLRAPLRKLIGEASHLDGVVCEARGLPAEAAALALAELNDLYARLCDLTDQVAAALPQPTPRRGRRG